MSLKLKYFVLNPKSKSANDPYAKASRQAMRIYADCIRDEKPVMANELVTWADTEMRAEVADYPINYKRKAPWTDSVGEPIYEGDTLYHLDGREAVVVHDPAAPSALSAWNLRYPEGIHNNLIAVLDSCRITKEKPQL